MSARRSLSVAQLVEQLARQLEQQGRRVTTAESCTGGGVAEALTERAGSSGWFEYGFVTYSNDAKADLLGVDERIFRDQGAVSRACVEAMARGALARSGADYAVAVSGVAGPSGGSPDKPVGTVWFCWAGRGGDCETRCDRYQGDRAAVREQSVYQALSGLLAVVEK